MLRIREDQVVHLAAGARRSLCDQIIGHVNKEMGAAAPGLSPAEARRRMKAILADARNLGLIWETHIAAYATLRIAGGPRALERLGYAHDPRARSAEIAEAFQDFLDRLPTPIWAGLTPR